MDPPWNTAETTSVRQCHVCKMEWQSPSLTLGLAVEIEVEGTTVRNASHRGGFIKALRAEGNTHTLYSIAQGLDKFTAGGKGAEHRT